MNAKPHSCFIASLIAKKESAKLRRIIVKKERRLNKLANSDTYVSYPFSPPYWCVCSHIVEVRLYFYACLINCTFKSSLTSSLTTMLPASVTALQVRPNSFLEIFPLISKPTLVCP